MHRRPQEGGWAEEVQMRRGQLQNLPVSERPHDGLALRRPVREEVATCVESCHDCGEFLDKRNAAAESFLEGGAPDFSRGEKNTSGRFLDFCLLSSC